MLILIEHNSDEIVEVFHGRNKKEVVESISEDKMESIRERLLDLGEIQKDEEITMEHLTSLYHDGDSENGFHLETIY